MATVKLGNEEVHPLPTAKGAVRRFTRVSMWLLNAPEKTLYANARVGPIEDFTGISDPYEEPADAEVVIDTTELTPEQAAQEILLHLEWEGYVGPAASDD